MQGMEVEHCLGTVVSIPLDHHKVDALLRHIATDRTYLQTRPVILRLHGILGNLLDDTEHFLPSVLASQGYSSITMNTLLANLRLFFGFGIFDDAMVQIDAVCSFLRKLGFQRIVLSGHGLGGCMAIRYAALTAKCPSPPSRKISAQHSTNTPHVGYAGLRWRM